MTTGIVGNLLVFGVLAYAAAIHAASPDFYHRSVQEDEYLEWSTFWAFALAAIFYGLAARQRRSRDATEPGWPWFFWGLAAFCLFVAMEEISWGQRLLAYRPPAYFLEHNFQQELNLHNIVKTDLRLAIFLAVAVGYGVALPLACTLPRIRDILERTGVTAPPWVLAPAFAATAVLRVAYPWPHTGEWAEAMLGLSLLCVAVTASATAVTRRMIGAGLASLVLGILTTQIWWLMTGNDPERLSAAQVELRALGEDFAAARTRTRCGLHKRVFTMVRKYDQEHLYEGAFAKLVGQGLPEERAEFFLDPWNSPYWIRHECSRDRRRRAIFVYSFGPNRLRDSTDWEIVPDDPGAWVSRPRPVSSD